MIECDSHGALESANDWPTRLIILWIGLACGLTQSV